MSPMPRGTDHRPLAQLTKLGIPEAKMRHESEAIDHRSIDEWIDRFCDGLSPYWAQMGLLLLTNVAKKRSIHALRQVRDRLEAPYRSLVPSTATQTTGESPHRDGSPLLRAPSSDNVVEFDRPELEKRFAEHAQEYEDQHGPIGAAKILRARRKASMELAARGQSELLTTERFALILMSVDA